MFAKRRNSRAVPEIGVKKHDDDVGFHIGNRNKALSRMRVEKFAILEIRSAERGRPICLIAESIMTDTVI